MSAHDQGPHGRHDSNPGQHSVSPAKRRLWVFVVGGVAVGLVVIGLVQRHMQYSKLIDETIHQAVPAIQVIYPQEGPSERTLSLPANVSAWYQAPIYAQVSGYVKMWYKDFGAVVKAGDVLAEINTPGLDAQYSAAQARLNVAKARYKLAEITAARWKALQGTQAVSRQEVDVQAANAAAEKAEMEAAGFDVERFAALENFKRIVAPFDGVVTSRFANVGDYVNAGRGDVDSQGQATELFSVADVHAMRVFVAVPQDYADVIGPGLQADLVLPQYPDKVFKAKYLTAATAFNSSTRTVTTELTIDNKTRELWPNSYATATFRAPGDSNILILPLGALIFRAEGTQVALVDDTNHVHLVSVTVGTNLGSTLQILRGVKKTDRVINNPSAGILDGQEVRVVQGTPGYNAPPVKPVAASAAAKANAAKQTENVRALPDDNAPVPEAGGRQ
ncbi:MULTISPECIES: efflux RND transporter periplasmic adaptor subunit [Acetobacter]|uniref:Efflux RND transporter periplasmic adaptor subunit n=1 Tax=Acetobacter thailandicus TaxID=1502842 RepID=A0ABT3QF51_9PROT|nr:MULTISPECIES: efflux RND transporter periplasmic adaptor subunit [Acetobacter]MBS0960046.1 efflux RND transporter periplasmic adaptor subunit [Acetobacter thailandicus]MBS0979375.1 efflux RND transporter periplasmic adaptor subunit [Acetobacter thailandicus]MBS0985579.1 efflux RND transporter periplasmic adaptor subunit [Acetobacter thailandicus]MBS1002494.1 efflux RND transporter periplasmic adaptor subunit [Acetobacter thailandicus]MCX2563909.1 efflux RND transporter periplasmic adaptor s